MLELRRLRLLRELHERGTIAAVADALQFTPWAVSQQLAMLEREAGVKLLERAGRGVRLTDAALVLVEPRRRAARPRRARRGRPRRRGGRSPAAARIAAFQSVALNLAIPAIARARREAPRLRCELVEAEPEQALPALALGDLDLVLGDEWQHQPWRLPDGLERHELLRDPVRSCCPPPSGGARTPTRSRSPIWPAPPGDRPRGMAWKEVTRRTCRELGGFEPDIRHRTNDATVSLALAARGLAVTLLPELALRGHDPGDRGARGRRAAARAHDPRRHPRRRCRAPLDAGAARRRPRAAAAALDSRLRLRPPVGDRGTDSRGAGTAH